MTCENNIGSYPFKQDQQKNVVKPKTLLQIMTSCENNVTWEN